MTKPNKLEGFFPKVLLNDLKLNWQESMQQVVARMDLVPRKEFDIQTKVLARTREKLEALEQQVKLLETALNSK